MGYFLLVVSKNDQSWHKREGWINTGSQSALISAILNSSFCRMISRYSFSTKWCNVTFVFKGLVMERRKLSAEVAVSREEAEKRKQEGTRKSQLANLVNDKRNLHLGQSDFSHLSLRSNSWTHFQLDWTVQSIFCKDHFQVRPWFRFKCFRCFEITSPKFILK